MRLPDVKLNQIRADLSLFETRTRVSKKQLQSLAGKLNFCAGVVFGGRVFLRRIIDSINLLKGDNHKMKLSADIRADISWWQSFMSTFNGKSMLLDRQHIQSVFTDSCTQAAGGIYQGDWFYINWEIDGPLCPTCILTRRKSWPHSWQYAVGPRVGETSVYSFILII